MLIFCGKQDMRSLPRAQEKTFLLTNGLGGYASVTAAYSVPRCDQGILVAAVKAPNQRINMVHRLRETLTADGREEYLSTQEFAGKMPAEEGYRHLSGFTYEHIPVWHYQLGGVTVKRTLCMAYGINTAAVLYEIENNTNTACTLNIDPFLKFAPKEDALVQKKRFAYSAGRISSGEYTLYLRTDAEVQKIPTCWQTLSYPEDAKDGRPAKGLTACCCRISKTVGPGETSELEVVFSMEKKTPSGAQILQEQLKGPVTRALRHS